MNSAQTMLYFREWGRVRDVLKSQGRPCGDMERHAFHLKALGQRKSSKDFKNADLDKVLAVFRAITEPDNLKAQLHALEQPEKRVSALLEEVWLLSHRCVDKPANAGRYLDSMAERIFGVDQYHKLTETQLATLRGILQQRIAQIGRKPADHQAPGELRSAATCKPGEGEVPW